MHGVLLLVVMWWMVLLVLWWWRGNVWCSYCWLWCGDKLVVVVMHGMVHGVAVVVGGVLDDTVGVVMCGLSPIPLPFP